jgi:hypothetical protein
MNYAVKHALSVSTAVLTAVLVSAYWSFSHEAWMVVSAFLVSQTTRGTPTKQSMLIFLLLVLIAICIPSESMMIMRDRVFDISIGLVFALFFGQLVFSVNTYNEFCLGVTPVLRSLKEYSSELSRFLARRGSKEALFENEYQIESTLVSKPGMYPEWVYELGFNPGLRSGFRFFLVNIERLTEIFFSTHYLVLRDVDRELMSELTVNIATVLQKNEELLQVLIEFFSDKKISGVTSDSDFTSDMEQLEKSLNQLVPGHFDLLDMSSDYVVITAIVRNLRDMRSSLLQLVMALPAV